ncbi:MAG: HEAT repeat domain-containing protein [Leptolyngbya sp. UWPOB_LEPTO1]|uniref:HEAT repeat domain-containing protein n=1 Tax=Leptolyngbya sp. UWPOB_LEPTO1 TaxID=2815653 RepID=UPI001ACB8E5E|nr:HEAT repeat domain-containing protein [Leptolyngbya sp. UWPOB_LEPTO1]MBN8562107.1 HEAT repeat domain-containing protein [Leptolyngbya sp. UWPOB_LEPTO1]
MKMQFLSFVKNMSLSLNQIAQQLDSDSTRDRMVALANLRDIPAEDAVPLIKKVLNDQSLQIRSMAVFALGIKQTDESFPILLNILETESDYGIRADAAGALGYLEDIRAFEPLVRLFYEDTDWLVRFSAAVALGNLKDARAKQVLMEALDSEEIVVQQAAIAALGEIKAVDAVNAILRFAQSEDWLIRQRLAEALGNMPSEKSLSALKYLEKDGNPNVAAAARVALERLSTEDI